MKIRSVDVARRIDFPDGRSLGVSPDGTDVPASMEAAVKQFLGQSEHIKEVSAAPAPATTRPATAKERE